MFFYTLKDKIATLEKFRRRWQFLGKQYKCNYAFVFAFVLALQARQSASFLYEIKEANMNDI